MLPGDIWGGQYGAVGGEYSDAVTGMVNAGPYIVAALCFRLRLSVSLYSAEGWLEDRPHLIRGGRRTVPRLVWGLSPGFAVLAVRFRTWHAQDIASSHKGG